MNVSQKFIPAKISPEKWPSIHPHPFPFAPHSPQLSTYTRPSYNLYIRNPAFFLSLQTFYTTNSFAQQFSPHKKIVLLTDTGNWDSDSCRDQDDHGSSSLTRKRVRSRWMIWDKNSSHGVPIPLTDQFVEGAQVFRTLWKVMMPSWFALIDKCVNQTGVVIFMKKAEKTLTSWWLTRYFPSCKRCTWQNLQSIDLQTVA